MFRMNYFANRFGARFLFFGAVSDTAFSDSVSFSVSNSFFPFRFQFRFLFRFRFLFGSCYCSSAAANHFRAVTQMAFPKPAKYLRKVSANKRKQIKS